MTATQNPAAVVIVQNGYTAYLTVWYTFIDLKGKQRNGQWQFSSAFPTLTPEAEACARKSCMEAARSYAAYERLCGYTVLARDHLGNTYP